MNDDHRTLLPESDLTFAVLLRRVPIFVFIGAAAWDGIDAAEPAIEIDVGAAFGAEGTIMFVRRLPT
jgi:hypothetical protein